jgi:hypothetical protein
VGKATDNVMRISNDSRGNEPRSGEDRTKNPTFAAVDRRSDHPLPAMSTLSTLQRRPPPGSRHAGAAVLLLCVLAAGVALLEFVRRSREMPVPVVPATEEAAETPSAATLAREAVGVDEDALAAGAADAERTEVDSAPAPAADARRDVCVRGRVVGQGRGVAGAEIRLLLRRLDRLSSQTRCKSVATGSDGTFSFAARAWRDVELQFEVHHDQFAPALHRDVFHGVSPGQQLDVGDVPLMAGGSVQGCVVDAHGNAVPAMTIRPYTLVP